MNVRFDYGLSVAQQDSEEGGFVRHHAEVGAVSKKICVVRDEIRNDDLAVFGLQNGLDAETGNVFLISAEKLFLKGTHKQYIPKL